MSSDGITYFTQRSLFNAKFDVAFKKYEGLDFSKRCFVYAGQSAAFPGMLKEELRSSPEAMKCIDEADQLCHELSLPAVSQYIFHPEKLTEEQRRLSRNPALLTVQVALSEALLANGVVPACVTGHSFGEYAAAVVSGAATFAEIFQIVALRDRLSPQPKTVGIMLVANASLEKLHTALGDLEFAISNINSPKQVVFSIRPQFESVALERLKTHRIAAKTLIEMAHPFHTEWMTPVAEALEKAILSSGVVFRAPVIPMISTLAADVVDRLSFATLGGGAGFAARLAGMTSRPVHFPNQVTAVIRSGVINFVEVGPGDTCAHFIKENLGESLHKVTSLSRYFESSQRTVARPKKVYNETSGLLRALSKVVSAVTGYNVDEISVHDSFQEDLGIDSIRKAEIVFQFMESMKTSDASSAVQMNLSQIKRLEDVIEHFQNASNAEAVQETQPPQFARFIETWQPRKITGFDRLNSRSHIFSRIYRFDLDAPTATQIENLRHLPAFATAVLVAPKLTTTIDGWDIRAEFNEKLWPWIREFRQIGQNFDRWPVRIALVRERDCHPYLQGLDGFFKSWLREDAFEAYKVIDFEALPSAAQLEAICRDEFEDQLHCEVRFLSGRREVKSWQGHAAHGELALGNAPVVVSLGGSRGIGAAILEHFAASQPDARIHFVGRSAAAEASVRQAISRIAAHAPAVVYERADVTKGEELQGVLSRIVEKHGRIDVLLNGAGQEFSKSLKAKSDDEIWTEFIGKVGPISVIKTAAQHFQIRHLINYSSVAAAFGNTGQSIYALGNQIQVAIGQRGSQDVKDDVCVTSLVLPPWDNLGMTENTVILNGLKASGVALLPKDVGVQMVLDEIRGEYSGQVAFLDARDLRAYDSGITDRAVYESQFSRVITTGFPMPMSRLNRRDQPYLNDHVINGNVIYPASSALATMFYLGYHYFKRPPCIEKFEVKNFLAPNLEKSNCRIEFERLGGSRLGMRILSERLIHYQCVASLSEDVEVSNEPGAFDCERAFSWQALYDNPTVSFGPHFQLAHKLWCSSSGEFQQMSVESQLLKRSDVNALDRLEQWFESVLQIYGFQLMSHTKRYWVPNRIERVVAHFDRPLTPEMLFRCQVHKNESGTAVGDGFMLNSQNETILKFTGIVDIDAGDARENENHRYREQADSTLANMGAQ